MLIFKNASGAVELMKYSLKENANANNNTLIFLEYAELVLPMANFTTSFPNNANTQSFVG